MRSIRRHSIFFMLHFQGVKTVAFCLIWSRVFYRMTVLLWSSATPVWNSLILMRLLIKSKRNAVKTVLNSTALCRTFLQMRVGIYSHHHQGCCVGAVPCINLHHKRFYFVIFHAKTTMWVSILLVFALMKALRGGNTNMRITERNKKDSTAIILFWNGLQRKYGYIYTR